MKPNHIKTKIFLDSGDPNETKQALNLLGFLDGQTTNPSLVSKNPEVAARIAAGKKFTEGDLLNFYKQIVVEISNLIPQGSVSIEVYADKFSSEIDLLTQAEIMNGWIANAHVKFPTTKSGLLAAEQFVKMGGRANMTLCFNINQAASVYTATRNATKGQVFYSSFIGRQFDNGINGINELKNVIQLYKQNQVSTEVLAASFRNFDQVKASLQLEPDIITLSLKYIEEWKNTGLVIPGKEFVFKPEGELLNRPFENLDLTKNWSNYDCSDPQTDAGLDKFAADWNGLLG